MIWRRFVVLIHVSIQAIRSFSFSLFRDTRRRNWKISNKFSKLPGKDPSTLSTSFTELRKKELHLKESTTLRNSPSAMICRDICTLKRFPRIQYIYIFVPGLHRVPFYRVKKIIFYPTTFYFFFHRHKNDVYHFICCFISNNVYQTNKTKSQSYDWSVPTLLCRVNFFFFHILCVFSRNRSLKIVWLTDAVWFDISFNPLVCNPQLKYQ